MNIDEIETKDDNKLTPEMENFIMKTFCKKNQNIFRLMNDRMKDKEMSISDLKNEIEAKKSPFSANVRTFIKAFKTEFLEKCLSYGN